MMHKKIQENPFWSLSITDTIDLLQTDEQSGISETEAQKRLEIFGLNIIEKSRQSQKLLILLNQFKSPLILILLFAGIVTLFLEHYRDAIFILAALAVNTILGFYQEHKAEKALEELKTYLKQRARVIRRGTEYEIDAANLVPGDIIRLTQGDRVPADGRLIFVNDFQIDEAILTGESLPANKQTEPAKDEAGLGDQNSMVFAGTLVTQGVGTAVVCRTDFATELGKIAILVTESKREETPLQKSIKNFSIKSSLFLGVLTLIIFLVGIALGYSKIEMFLTSVAIAVAAVPEGLPIAMTVILAIGVQRMARRNGVVRKLVAAEALGSTTIILTDKTGTLTMAKMAVSKILPVSGSDEKRLLELAVLNTNVLIENRNEQPDLWRINGRVLEKSLVLFAGMRGILIEEIKKKISVLNFLPFNSANKFSAVLIDDHGKQMIAFLGAPDVFINHSTLNQKERQNELAKIETLAQAGERVVGIATKEISTKKGFSFLKDLNFENLTFEGLITLHDPVRPSVKEAIRQVNTAGIRIIIMTGDHRGTAESVAREVGILTTAGSIIDAPELRALSDADLKKRLMEIKVIARVSPFDKLRVVKALQESGEIVAMTGDGVNDAPSIKQANIGIAMGSGTEVARDVADLVLLDDNFETIAQAVQEGRQIMNNIRKVLVYLLSSVADSLFLIGGALLAGIALPLNPLQILWVNFFSDSFPAIAFAFEKKIDGLGRRPHDIRAGLFDPIMKSLVIFIGLATSALLFGLYWFLLHTGFDEKIVRTFIFASFGTYSLFLTFSLRSLEKSIFEYSFFSNRYLILGVGIGLILMIAAIYLPILQTLFNTVALTLPWIAGVILIGMINIAAVELGKLFFRHRHQTRQA